MSYRTGQVIFASVVGLVVAIGAYKWISSPDGRDETELQERIVKVSRNELESILAVGTLQIVDPLAPDRRVGKAYIYRQGAGWAISGHYRRGESDRWHPFLMQLDHDWKVTLLKVQDRDQDLVRWAQINPVLEASN